MSVHESITRMVQQGEIITPPPHLLPGAAVQQ